MIVRSKHISALFALALFALSFLVNTGSLHDLAIALPQQHINSQV
jgi:hypothetical protein